MKETTPKSDMPMNSMSPMQAPYVMPKSHIVFVALLIIASFVMGSLYTKVQFLQNGVPSGTGGGNNAPSANAGDQGGAQAGPAKYKSFDEAMEAMAKIAKADGKKLVECMNGGSKKAVVDTDVSKGNTAGVTGTPAFFINGRLIPGAVPIEEFKKIIDEELAGKADKSVTRVTVDIGDAITEGPKTAPIKLIEFSDFQCPYCERAYPTITQLMKDYNGKIQLAYLHFPLISIHPHAQKAAEAAVCARDQGKFWEFHNALFENQADWVQT